MAAVSRSIANQSPAKLAGIQPGDVIVRLDDKPIDTVEDLFGELRENIDALTLRLEDVSRLAIVTEELLRRGHSEEEVRGILGENFLRFWERAQAARRTDRTG